MGSSQLLGASCKKRTERAPQGSAGRERGTQRVEEQRPTDPHTHTGDRRTGKTDFISVDVSATNDRLPIDSHWEGRWITKTGHSSHGRS